MDEILQTINNHLTDLGYNASNLETAIIIADNNAATILTNNDPTTLNIKTTITFNNNHSHELRKILDLNHPNSIQELEQHLKHYHETNENHPK